MSEKRLIWSGDAIRTTAAFDAWHSYPGRYLHGYADGSIAAVLVDAGTHGYEEFGINLDPDEWELVDSPPALHKDAYERGLFDD